MKNIPFARPNISKKEITAVSKTLKGAKRYATLHDFDKVGIRFNSGYHVKIVATKINNKWND